MKKPAKILLSLCLLAVVASRADAAVVYSGSFVEVGGPGIVSLDIYATAVDQAEEIVAWNLQIDLSDPDLAFDGLQASLTPNPTFELRAAGTGIVPGPGNTWFLGATSTVTPGLALNVGETATIASILVDVLGGDGGQVSVTSLNLSNANAQQIPFSFADTNGSPRVGINVIPEPNSFALLAICSAALGYRRRRR